MRLDSHPPTMQAAIGMYRKLGFREVSPDPLEPVEGLIYMELQLDQNSCQLSSSSVASRTQFHLRENSLASLPGNDYYAVNPMATPSQDENPS